MSTETDHLVALDRLQCRYADLITRRAWSELPEIFLSDTGARPTRPTRPTRPMMAV